MAITGNSSKLIGELGKSEKAVEGFSQRAGRSMSNFGKAAQGPLLVLGGAITGAVLQYERLGSAIFDMAQRTGFSTETLSVLRFAADQTGTSIEGLEKAVRRMQRSILDADAGLSTQVRAFKALGLSIEELRTLTPEEQFMRIGAAIAGITDPTERATRAQELFGRSGAELLPLFAEGAEGMARYAEQASELGLVMDLETAAKAERMGDAIDAAKQTLNGMAIDIGSRIAPSVTFLAEGFAALPGPLRAMAAAAAIAFTAMKVGILSVKSALITSGIGVGIVLLGEALNFLGFGVGKVADETERLNTTQSILTRLTALNVEELKVLEGAYAAALELGAKDDEQRAKATNTWLQATDAVAAFRATLRAAGLDELTNAQTLAIVRDAIRLMGDAAFVAQQQTDDLSKSVQGLTARALASVLAKNILSAPAELAGAVAQDMFEAARRQLQPLVAQEEALEALVESLLGSVGTRRFQADEGGGGGGGGGGGLAGALEDIASDARHWTGAIEGVHGPLLELIEATDVWAAANQSAADAIEATQARQLEELVEAFIRGGDDAVAAVRAEQAALDQAFAAIADGLSDLGVEVPEQFRELFDRIQEEIAEGVENAAGAFVPNVAAFEAAVGAASAAGMLSEDFHRQLAGQFLQPMAHGGIALRPTAALIGERGPEAVIPLSDSRFGGGSRELVINFNGPVADRRAAEEMVRGAIVDLRRRGVAI